MSCILKDSAGGYFVSLLLLIFSAPIVTTFLPYPAHAGQIVSVSQEFQANVTTEYNQLNPSVGMDSGGGSVIVWGEQGPDPSGLTSGISVKGRLFSPDGTPAGGEFTVNSHTSTSYFPYMPDAAMSPDGSFIAAWAADGSTGDPTGITVQRFAPGGIRLGSESVISGDGLNCMPAVSCNGTSGYVVVWEHTDFTTMQTEVSGRVFAPDGTQVGTGFGLPTHTSYYDSFPAVGMDASGGFTVAWVSRTEGPGTQNIYAMRFDALGNPLTPEFRVNTTDGMHNTPAVASDPYGGFIVAWFGTDASGGNYLYMQSYDRYGAASGQELAVNISVLDSLTQPAVGMDGYGNTVSVWQNYMPDELVYGIFTQLVEGTSATGCEARLSDPLPSASYQSTSPDVAVNANGDIIVAWEASDRDGSGKGVIARRYAVSATSPTIPDAPVGLLATQHPEGGAQLSWLPEPDADGYVVYRDGAAIAVTDTEYYHDSAVASYGAYCYTVTATSPDCYGGGESAHSNELCVLLLQNPPQPEPEPFLVYVHVTGTASLRWDAPALGYEVAGYEVYRSDEYVATTPRRFFKDVDLGNGDYYYAVYAVDASGENKTSIEFTVSLPNEKNNGKGPVKSAKN